MTSKNADYAKGYAAGKRRKVREQLPERRARVENAFWQRAMLSCLGAALASNNWKSGDKPITSIAGLTALAGDFADEALRLAIRKGKLS